MSDVNKTKSDIGVKSVMDHLESEGYACQDVRLIGGENKGYDVLATKNGDIKIEVKCSQKEFGVPDCFPTEFDNNLGLVADFLYIVRIDDVHKPIRIEILSKEEFNRYSENHIKIERIRVASRLKTDLKNKKIGKMVTL